MKPNSKMHISASTLEANIELPAEQWLKPSDVSAILGLDEKWLAAAREGLKELDGPPFIKIGPGRTSPIRYPVNKLIAWMKSFPLQGVTTSNFTSFTTFQASCSLSDVWPCVLYEDGSIDELFISINSNRCIC